MKKWSELAKLINQMRKIIKQEGFKEEFEEKLAWFLEQRRLTEANSPEAEERLAADYISED